MKIAVLTITLNDDFRLKEWKAYYDVYKDEIYKHIIVDNGSPKEYVAQMKAIFPESIFIERTSNGGCTGAYNDGLRLALADPEIDAIMLVANDVAFEPGGVTKLYEFLYSNERYGMVMPVQMRDDDKTVASFGRSISKYDLHFISLNSGAQYDSLPQAIVCDSVPGGMNMAKRYFYEKVGLQDEYLFMYADEIDMGLRGKNAGFEFAATKQTKCWHKHKNRFDKQSYSPLAGFLMGRNEIYLAKKHTGFGIQTCTILRRLYDSAFLNTLAWVKWKHPDERKMWWWYFRGVLCGIFGSKKIPSSL